MHDCRLGNREPTELLREMRRLANNRLSDEVLKEFFYEQLPPVVSSILITSGAQTLDKAAEATNRAIAACRTCGINPWTCSRLGTDIVAAVNPAPVVFSSTCHQHSTPTTPDSILANISTIVVAAVDALMEKRFNQQSRSFNHSYTPICRSCSTSHNARHQFDQCWYHYKFGKAAWKCTDWCKYANMTTNNNHNTKDNSNNTNMGN